MWERDKTVLSKSIVIYFKISIYGKVIMNKDS